jgi:hypothetical protein
LLVEQKFEGKKHAPLMSARKVLQARGAAIEKVLDTVKGWHKSLVLVQEKEVGRGDRKLEE